MHLSVLHKYSTCKDYLATNQFNISEFERVQSLLWIMKVLSSEVLLLCPVIILYCSSTETLDESVHAEEHGQ